INQKDQQKVTAQSVEQKAQKGSYVPVKTTVADFKDILEGKYDHIPEDAFRLVGSMQDVIAKAKDMGVEV
ncbi:hypothetical protein QRX48_12845, partial [Staphylococcus warneri]